VSALRGRRRRWLRARVGDFLPRAGRERPRRRGSAHCRENGGLPMTSDPPPRSATSHQLGVLAMRFRRTCDEAVRRAISAEYAREVQRLIETGSWSEAPAFEDQLPDEWMPEAFFAYWCPESPP